MTARRRAAIGLVLLGAFGAGCGNVSEPSEPEIAAAPPTTRPAPAPVAPVRSPERAMVEQVELEVLDDGVVVAPGLTVTPIVALPAPADGWYVQMSLANGTSAVGVVEFYETALVSAGYVVTVLPGTPGVAVREARRPVPGGDQLLLLSVVDSNESRYTSIHHVTTPRTPQP